MRKQPNWIVAGGLALTAVVSPIGPTLSAQALQPGADSPFRAQQHLVSRFAPLMRWAVAPNATRQDRFLFVRFLQGEVVPYLVTEGGVVYPVVDSLTGSTGYATTAAILDREAIGRLIDRLEEGVNTRDPAQFVAQAYALSGVLDTYFEKDRALIQSIIADRLDEREVRALAARMQAERTGIALH